MGENHRNTKKNVEDRTATENQSDEQRTVTHVVHANPSASVTAEQASVA